MNFPFFLRKNDPNSEERGIYESRPNSYAPSSSVSKVAVAPTCCGAPEPRNPKSPILKSENAIFELPAKWPQKSTRMSEKSLLGELNGPTRTFCEKTLASVTSPGCFTSAVVGLKQKKVLHQGPAQRQL